MKKKDFITDYLIYILLKSLGPLLRNLPPAISFFIGRRLGELFFVFDLKHRAVAYANMRTALGDRLLPGQIRSNVLGFYRAFGQNIIEIFYIPKFDKAYLDRYISIEGYGNVQEGFKRGKGVIFVAMHAGSWEMANIICANLGFPFSLFVRGQNFPLVEKVLNSYRGSKGCRFIQRENEIRDLVRVLKANESVAMTIDQGGKSGTTVKFFGKYASMASGAVRLALKLGCSLVPVFPIRVNGAKIKFFVEPVFQLKSTGNLEEDVKYNLQELVKVFEKYIARYPREYLWTYRSWKYSSERSILILSDGKTGHLRQSQALAGICAEYLSAKGITSHVETVEVKFKSPFSSKALTAANCLAGKYICQGCQFCLRVFLEKDNYSRLIGLKPDLIVSCGSSLVPVNYLLSRENQARSLVVMRPSIFGVHRFDLVVIPSHDRPLRRKNVVITDGALNLIDEDYLKDQSAQLIRDTGVALSADRPTIGILLGGSAGGFRLGEEIVRSALQSVKAACSGLNCQILATTSRRTSSGLEELVKNEFRDFEPAKLVIIANEKNYSSAVGGILGVSRVLVTTGESISMISEAVSSLKPVIVLKSPGLSFRHRLFLENLQRNRRIRLVEARDTGGAIRQIMAQPPGTNPLKDKQKILEALRRII